jgi:Zn-dependent metalloprotease
MKSPTVIATFIRRTLIPAVIAVIFGASLLAQPNQSAAATYRPANVRALSLPSDVQTALQAISEAKVTVADQEGLPTFLHGKIHHIRAEGSQAFGEADLVPVIQIIRPIFRLGERELAFVKSMKDSAGLTHIRYDQTKNGRPVVGTRLMVHVQPDGTVFAVNGNARGNDHVPVVPTVSPESAKAAVHAWHGSHGSVASKQTHRRLVYVVTTGDRQMHLAHEIDSSGTSGDGGHFRELIYVDAIDGSIVDCHSQIMTAEALEVYYGAWVYIAQDNDVIDNSSLKRRLSPYIGPCGISACDTNYTYLDTVWKFYNDTFERDSVDGNGLPLKGYAHYFYPTAPNHYPYYNTNSLVNNAFWQAEADDIILDSNAIFYGSGDGTNYHDFTSALDITAHEATHGVTQFCSGLLYENEPGAINESMSDIFGVACKIYADSNHYIGEETWKVGKDVVVTGSQFKDALRYMDNPTKDWPDTNTPKSRDYYSADIWIEASDLPNENNDFGGVHHNSGIGNLAFCLMVLGGTHPRSNSQHRLYDYSIPTTTVPSIGLADAQMVFYLANTYYLGPGAQYTDLREATRLAALNGLVNHTTSERAAIAANISIAWDVVGVPTFSNRVPMNVSTRGYVGTDDTVMIAGFVLSGGTSAKTLLLRGAGPALAASPFNLSGTISDPQISLMSGSNQIDSNDNWSSSGNASTLASTAATVGAFALANPSYDAALLHSLSSGAYTLILSRVNGASGIGLVEAYDTDTTHTNSNHLVNISTRAFVGTGDNVLIAGFVISGPGNKYLLIRGVGPALAPYLNGTISDPKIVLYDGSNNQLLTNDNWGSNPVNVVNDISRMTGYVGAFPFATASYDAALLVSLPAGVYSVQMSGVDGCMGIGMVEVYEINSFNNN